MKLYNADAVRLRQREGGSEGRWEKEEKEGREAKEPPPPLRFKALTTFPFFEVMKNWGSKVKNVAGKIMFFLIKHAHWKNYETKPAEIFCPLFYQKCARTMRPSFIFSPIKGAK